MYEKSIKTGNGLIKISTRFVGAEERVILTLSGKNGVYVVDSSALLSEQEANETIDALQAALNSRRPVPPEGK